MKPCIERLVCAVLFAAALGLGTAGEAAAQVNPEIANCQELTDEGTIEQVKICETHLGCRMVIRAYQACTKARKFLDNLRDSIGDGVKTLFGYRKEVRPENVFEAMQTEVTKRVDAMPGWKDESASVRQAVAKAGTEVTSGKTTGGADYVYIGDVKNGKPEGHGTLFTASGSATRGDFSNGLPQGRADMVIGAATDRPSRTLSEFEQGERSGKGVSQLGDGAVFDGTFAGNTPAQGSYTYANGTRYVGSFEKGTGNFVAGTLYRADGSVSETGSYRGNVLNVGSRMDASGKVTEEVNKPRDAMLAAEERQRVAVERTRKDEDDRLAAQRQREAEQAARDAAFRDSLQRLGAGPLYALADELAEKGDRARSREVLRSLITRFPDHALAGTAAQQLAANATPATTAGTKPAAPGATGAATGSSTARASGPAIHGPADGIEVGLTDRWTNTTGGPRLRVSAAAYESGEARMEGCRRANRWSDDCMPRYDIGDIKIESRMRSGADADKVTWQNNLQCRYTPSSYSNGGATAQQICQNLLMLAIHEDAKFQMEAFRSGGDLYRKFAGTPVISGAQSGNCAADLSRLGQEYQALNKRRSADAGIVSTAQLAMFMNYNYIRVLESSCKGDPAASDLNARRQQLAQSYGLCKSLSSSEAACVPKVPN